MLALLLGAGSGVNPSQGIPGPFSFKRLQIWITDALVERTAQLINRSSPTSRNHSPHPSTFSSSPVCTLRRPTSLALPSGLCPRWCNNHPSDEKHVASLVLGYLTVGDHAIENNFWIIDAICYLPHDLPSRRLFRG